MFFSPVDFSHAQDLLAWPRGWLDILLTGFAIGIAWAIDRRLAHRRGRADAAARRETGLTRVTFPVLALLLLLVAVWFYHRAFGAPIVLAVAIPLMAAMAVIRAIIYGLRRLFPKQDWLPPWERAIGAIVWLLLLLYFVGVLPEVLATLDDVEIPLGKSRVTLLSIVSALGVVLGTLLVTLWISGLIESRLSRATRLDSNLRAVLSRLIRAALLALGVLIALQGVGFDLTLLTVFGGAIGVGIGLGLQKLASNYIAGFTILLDRSIRLGDTITVEGRWVGVVTSVTARYVLVRRLDGVEVIVPNETLVTTTVLNHSHAAPQIRIPVTVPVPLDSDVEQALKVLEEAALADPRVLRDAPHAPGAFVAGFADTGVQLELGVWVNDPLIDQLNLRSVIHRAILRAFGERGIALAYPHRELVVTDARRSADGGDPGVSAGMRPSAGPASPA
jgi:small-conductance mechanosensitive channel